MRVGWREYLRQRLRKPSQFFSVGIEIGSDSVLVSTLRDTEEGLTWVKQARFPSQDWQEQLIAYCEQEELSNAPCHVVFAINKYQLLQVDRPQVDDSELAQALVWSVKDLVPTQDELVIDYFEPPAQSAGANKLNVVAIPQQEVMGIVTAISDAELQLKSISIAELATCDLLAPSEEAVLTLVQQAGQEMCINIVKNGQLYFTRRLRGYENLSSFTPQELQMGVGDNLSVEIQRSMDYFESQLRQAAVKKIKVGVQTNHIGEFAELLHKLTFMPVEPLVPDIKPTDDLSFSDGAYSSLGAAMAEKYGQEVS